MVDRLDEIDQRRASLRFRQKPYRYVQGERVEPWFTQAETANTLQDLVTDDVPYLLARVRKIEAVLREIASDGADDCGHAAVARDGLAE